jgi:hypothetical protein
MTNSQSVRRIAVITQNDAMILPYLANPARMEFSERTDLRDTLHLTTKVPLK